MWAVVAVLASLGLAHSAFAATATPPASGTQGLEKPEVAPAS